MQTMPREMTEFVCLCVVVVKHCDGEFEFRHVSNRPFVLSHSGQSSLFRTNIICFLTDALVNHA